MTATASAAFHFGSQASLLPYRATVSEVVAMALDSTDGVRTCLFEVVGSDGIDWAPSDYTIATPAATSATVTMLGTMPAAVIVKCTVNGGRALDPITGEFTRSSDLIKTARIYVTTDETIFGLQVGAAGESTEASSQFGSAVYQNEWPTAIQTLRGPQLLGKMYAMARGIALP